MSSVSKKPSRLILKTVVLEQTDQIEAALSQGYTYEEIAHEMERATKEAYPDDSKKWVIIAPSSLRKYHYQGRKRRSRNPMHSKHTALANPFKQRS